MSSTTGVLGEASLTAAAIDMGHAQVGHHDVERIAMRQSVLERILVVDDDPSIASCHQQILRVGTHSCTV
ncbi:MAG TPA: hypothetical protein VJN68_05770 [Burkholderiaceae bacterium]|nr:hypothetical protein [Burkholderiaceae bacterium]